MTNQAEFTKLVGTVAHDGKSYLLVTTPAGRVYVSSLFRGNFEVGDRVSLTATKGEKSLMAFGALTLVEKKKVAPTIRRATALGRIKFFGPNYGFVSLKHGEFAGQDVFVTDELRVASALPSKHAGWIRIKFEEQADGRLKAIEIQFGDAVDAVAERFGLTTTTSDPTPSNTEERKAA